MYIIPYDPVFVFSFILSNETEIEKQNKTKACTNWLTKLIPPESHGNGGWKTSNNVV